MTVSAAQDIERALAELEEAFPGRVSREAEDAAGVVVRISDVPLSSRWSMPVGELWFQIPFHYPDAAIYPYYLTGAVPSGGVISGLQATQWRSMAVTQVSLRHNGWNPNYDTALGSVRQTMAWLANE